MIPADWVAETEKEKNVKLQGISCPAGKIW